MPTKSSEKLLLEKQAQQIAELEQALTVESALDRLRASAMKMQSSADLNTLIAVVYAELKKLDFEIKNSVIITFEKGKRTTNWWFANVNAPTETMACLVPDNQHPFYLALLKMWKAQQSQWTYDLKGKGKKDWEDLMFTRTELANLPAAIIAGMRVAKRVAVSVSFHSFGCLMTSSVQSLTTKQFNIIERFARVFEQCYSRFLDIQKAENQTKKLGVLFQENERLLHSILPLSIAEQLKKNNQTIVQRFDNVAILFADLVGFTILSEKLTPKEVVDLLNGLFSKFDDLTDKYGIEKIKTIGDAYMVAAGVPITIDHPAKMLFSFAQEMLQTLTRFNQENGRNLALRIGMSSGPVVAGVIGKKKFTYDLWGDTVNTAARMEAYGKSGCIQVSPTTYQLLKTDYRFEKISNVKIKGKGQMDVYLWKAIR